MWVTLSVFAHNIILRVLFGPVKPEFGVNPSGQKKKKKKKKKTFNSEHLNFPGKDYIWRSPVIFGVFDYIKTHNRVEINL